jgi:2-dehydro-3-deoxyphosphooctonate aldolase (KDO 8-P synthase)
MYPLLEHLKHTETGNFFLIAGPCVIEDDSMPFTIAERLIAITERLSIPFAFKASYRKANRSRIDSFTGIGDQAGLEILGAIRQRYGIPVVTDIHSEQEAAAAAPYVDVLQIPAFLCRQTSLLEAAAQTDRCVNVKKGQFLSPEAMTLR